MIKNILVSAGVAIAVVALGFALLGQPSTKVIERTIEKLGAFPGTSFLVPSLDFNGITYHYRTMAFQTGTTTLCTFEVPEYNRATTTLVSVGMRVDAPATTSGQYRVFTGLGLNSTTTLLAGGIVGVRATGTVVTATTSLTTNDVIMSTNDRYVVFEVEGTGAPYFGNSGLSGACSAVFRQF